MALSLGLPVAVPPDPEQVQMRLQFKFAVCHWGGQKASVCQNKELGRAAEWANGHGRWSREKNLTADEHGSTRTGDEARSGALHNQSELTGLFYSRSAPTQPKSGRLGGPVCEN